MLHPSELILNPDNSIYHLKLKPEHLAKKIIIVGDPGRVISISSRFDKIEFKIENREFVTHTGTFKGNRISVIATGIGADNIDIVLNEIDAIANIDLEKKEIMKDITSLEIVRIGTCGSIQESVPSDEIVISTHAIGLDGLLNFYEFEMDKDEKEIYEAFQQQTQWDSKLNIPYLVSANQPFADKIGEGFHKGITITANGFYAPQGRRLRLLPKHENINENLRAFSFKEHRVVNYEMETSALYGLSKIMGHKACTVCAVVANRYANSFSKDYKPVISNLIDVVLDRLIRT